MNTLKKTGLAIAAIATLAASSAMPVAAQAGNIGQKAFIGGAAGGFFGALVGTSLANRPQTQTVVVHGGYVPQNCLVAQQGYNAYGQPVITYVRVC